jgi:hypothetical protein
VLPEVKQSFCQHCSGIAFSSYAMIRGPMAIAKIIRLDIVDEFSSMRRTKASVIV